MNQFSHSNEDMDDIIRIIKSLENSGVLIDGVSKILIFLVCHYQLI